MTHGSHLFRRFALMMSVPALMGLIGTRFTLAINCTESLPEHVFLIDKADKTDFAEQDFIAFTSLNMPPIPDGLTIVKKVAGRGGDQIRVIDREVFIHETRLARAKPVSDAGTPLSVTREMVVPEHYYYVHAPHPDSYDSRYANVGLIGPARIVGRAYVIF